MATRILIADDHGILREALSSMLSKELGMEVVGEAQDGRAAVELTKQLRPDVVLMDMEAGIEHLGRATSGFVDCLIIVLEPGRRSIETAEKIRQLASDLQLKKLAAVGNKIRRPEDEAFIREHLHGIPLLGCLPYREAIIQADMEARPPFEGAEDLVLLAEKMIDQLEEEAGRPA